MRVIKGEIGTQKLTFMSLVRLVLEYGSVCWDPCREGHINALDWVQKKAELFTNRTKDSDWENLGQCRTIARFLSVLWGTAWKAVRDRLRGPYSLCRFDYVGKIRDRKHRMDIGKYLFVNMTIENRNQLPAETLGTFLFKHEIFRTELGSSY